MEKYDIIQDILITGDVHRQKDGVFKFEHEWKDGTANDFDHDILLNGEVLWLADLRFPEFIKSETKRRKQARQKWKATLFWGFRSCCIVSIILRDKNFRS